MLSTGHCSTVEPHPVRPPLELLVDFLCWFVVVFPRSLDDTSFNLVETCDRDDVSSVDFCRVLLDPCSD